MALKDIDHVVILMLENRSFDHMLGYLSRPGPGQMKDVEGIGDDAWVADHAISYEDPETHQKTPYTCQPLAPSQQELTDPAHGYKSIKVQIHGDPAGGPKMQGFIQSYATQKHPPKKKNRGHVMGYYEAAGVPMFDFLARNFAVCDHWFSPLPAGTQPNRFMAMRGHSTIKKNKFPLPKSELVYDWLDRVLGDRMTRPWCVYQWGGYMPFFIMMGKWFGPIIRSINDSVSGTRDLPFRRFKFFKRDWTDNGHEMPAVIFVEPEYSDGPHDDPSDDHPPTGVGRAQLMIRDIYNVLISNEARWKKTMFIITYDEHGGFYDHVEPLGIPKTVAGEAFQTTGVRVPALVVSPQVEPGKVFKQNLDHTSILKMLADRFADGDIWPEVVERNPAEGGLLGRLADVLKAPSDRRPEIPEATLKALKALEAYAPNAPAVPRDNDHGQATVKGFQQAALRAAREYPEAVAGDAFGNLAGYAKAVEKAPPPAAGEDAD